MRRQGVRWLQAALRGQRLQALACRPMRWSIVWFNGAVRIDLGDVNVHKLLAWKKQRCTNVKQMSPKRCERHYANIETVLASRNNSLSLFCRFLHLVVEEAHSAMWDNLEFSGIQLE